ncbi:hypothetical protein ESZ50_01660 [Weissella muntiaci]|uniref:SWIM-type domain-containing protein n=1 Tax=Weissella muntiaci TaxID=2508881 RepID=A0A6C2C9H8_9LACO|nr:hypothetical protein [Weissella muntiaci]TYC50668.1 hypothetical protein ESZ50_01660 [Weissella muntiaci]
MKVQINRATMESRTMNAENFSAGIALFEVGALKIIPLGNPNSYIFVGDGESGVIRIKGDGRDVKQFYCTCDEGAPLMCKHVMAAILTIQGGMIESPLFIGKRFSESLIVDDTNMTGAVKGDLMPVFATPFLIGLLENTATDCIASALSVEESQVGTEVHVFHTAGALKGARITATATITKVYGRRITFDVVAREGNREIGHGTHTRMIVDRARLLESLQQ